MHLLHSGLSIIFGHVMQHKRARDGVEAAVRKRKPLGKGHLKGDRKVLLAGLRGRALDHLRSCIDAGHGSGGGYPLGEGHRQLAGAASHIENPITGLQFKIISEHLAQPLTASAEQSIRQVVRTRPVNEAVMAVVHDLRGSLSKWRTR